MSTGKGQAYLVVHKFSAGVCLLAFLVIAISGMSAGSSVFSIAYRMMLVTIVVSCISRVVTKIFQHSEEMSSGKG
jgi:hypothetical protein